LFGQQGLHHACGMLASAAGGTGARLPPGARVTVEGQGGLQQGLALDIGHVLQSRLDAAQFLDAARGQQFLAAVAGFRREFPEEFLGGSGLEFGEITRFHLKGQLTPTCRRGTSRGRASFHFVHAWKEHGTYFTPFGR
jgi:hypothetical protein